MANVARPGDRANLLSEQRAITLRETTVRWRLDATLGESTETTDEDPLEPTPIGLIDSSAFQRSQISRRWAAKELIKPAAAGRGAPRTGRIRVRARGSLLCRASVPVAVAYD